jgi:hypothetical protein
LLVSQNLIFRENGAKNISDQMKNQSKLCAGEEKGGVDHCYGNYQIICVFCTHI